MVFLALDFGFHETTFNITEDMNVGEVDSEDPQLNYLPELLSRPLPVDLPQGNKDLLILMAAYYGNIDRYARLRRPCVIKWEPGFLVHGIYHNSMFAIWCSTQTISDPLTSSSVKKAIYARMIMDNDLSRIVNMDTRQPHKEFLSHIPYLIWFPTPARDTTYKFLASAVRDMRPSVLHAAVDTEDKSPFDWMIDDLGVAPTASAFQEAHARNWGRGGGSSYFIRRLEARSQELGIDLAAPVTASFKMYSATPQLHSTWLAKEVTPRDVHGAMEDWGIYDGCVVDASTVELFASAPEPWRPGSWMVELDYKDWPKMGNAH